MLERGGFLKKLLACVLVLLILATPVLVLAKVQKYDAIKYYDLDGDGECDDLVYVKITDKTSKRNTSLKRAYFDEAWGYLGEELWVNGELFEDTFTFNDNGVC